MTKSALPSRKDVVSELLGRRLWRRSAGRRFSAESVDAIPMRDLMELYLSLSGVASAEWVDTEGRVSEARSPLVNMAAILRDAAMFLPERAAVVRHVAQLESSRVPVAPFVRSAHGNAALFLRTDHWFGIKSGGSVGHLKGVIDGLRSLDVRTHVVASDVLAMVDSEHDFTLLPPDYRRFANIPNFPELRYSASVVRTALAAATSLKPQFVYQRYSLGNTAGVALRHSLKIPYVCEYNGSLLWIARNWGRTRIYHEDLMERIETLNLRSADLVVVVSEPSRDEVLARGVNPERVLVNPNGVDPEMYRPEVDGAAIRSSLGWSSRTVVGFIGTFGKWHGADVLARAFAHLVRAYPALRHSMGLVLVGDGATMPEVRAVVESEGLHDCVALPGLVPQQDGPRWLAACDILASPHVPNPDGTPFFGSPTKLFEYMAMGRAIIASSLDQIGQILSHGHTAYLVPPADVEALAEGLRHLAEHPELRAELAGAARGEAVQKWSWQRHTERILTALENISQR